LRYVLTANAPETKDNDFTWADFQARNNNELVAVFGNFVNRVSVLTQKYYDGVVPKAGLLTQTDQNTINELRAYPAVIASSIEKYRFREAQTEFMNVARLGNKYLADAEPWKLVKTDPERTQTVLFVALQITAALAVLAEPFLPHTSAKLKDTLSFDALATKPTWPEMTHEVYWLPEGHQITQTPLLFSRIEDEQMAFQRNKLEATKNKNALMTTSVTPQKETIAFEDFAKMDLRVGTITAAHKMPKANKLLVLKVDTGLDVRTIVSGIAEHYAPEEIIGQRVSVLINLAERNLRGETSQGMILMAQNNDGRLIFVQPNDTDCPNGAVIS
jgi:methionyl-tRNA synthetase